MDQIKRVGFAAFGEINTPIERLNMKHDEAIAALRFPDVSIIDAGLVIDDPAYETADAAIAKLKAQEFDLLVVCVCGWIPSHAVIRVTDEFRHLPMLLWGLCGWMENGRIVTTAEQAGTSALRPTFEAMGYRFKYVWNTIGQPLPKEKLRSYICAAYAARELRHLRVGSMGYRDMLLYGTQYEGYSMRRDLGVEVEPFEMLEMVRNIESLTQEEIDNGIRYVADNWKFELPCSSETIKKGVQYALAVGKKIKERKYSAVSLLDVDGMKKLMDFPPAMVFMLLTSWYGVETIPENDIMGAVTQLIARLLTGESAPYLEFYEYFNNSVLAGVPDYIPDSAADGDIKMLSTSFGLLAASVLNVSTVRTGRVTCARLAYRDGKYYMHMFTGNAKTPAPWNEFGWVEPIPQLPSLEIEPDNGVDDFASKVASQHVIVTFGDNAELFSDFCALTGITLL